MHYMNLFYFVVVCFALFFVFYFYKMGSSYKMGHFYYKMGTTKWVVYYKIGPKKRTQLTAVIQARKQLNTEPWIGDGVGIRYSSGCTSFFLFFFCFFFLFVKDENVTLPGFSMNPYGRADSRKHQQTLRRVFCQQKHHAASQCL